MIIKEGDKVQVYSKGTRKFLVEFTATQNMCKKLLTRYLHFKYNIRIDSVTWRKVK